MKTINLLSIMAVAAMMLASCGSSKQISNGSSNYASSGPKSVGVDIILPCVDESMDDANYFRDFGEGQALTIQDSRTAAIKAARGMIRRKLAEFVQGVSSDYSRTVSSGQSGASKTQSMLEDLFDGVVSDMLNHAEKICEKMQQSEDGNYHSFIAIQIPKGAMINKMANALSANEELEIEFNRDQFRKFAEDKAAKMLEAKKSFGY